jgi:hypothetical protein
MQTPLIRLLFREPLLALLEFGMCFSALAPESTGSAGASLVRRRRPLAVRDEWYVRLVWCWASKALRWKSLRRSVQVKGRLATRMAVLDSRIYQVIQVGL